MPAKFKILILDDDINIVETIKGNLEEFQDVEVCQAATVEEAKDDLQDCDALILDLNFDPDNEVSFEGTEVLKESMDRHYKLVIVFSAFTYGIDGIFPEGPFLLVLDKGGGGDKEYAAIKDALQKFKRIKEELEELWNEMKALFDDIMLKDFQDTFLNLENEEIDPEMVIAFVSFRLSTYLQNRSARINGKIPSQSIFIVPPVTKTDDYNMPVMTGDIFSDQDGALYVVISPPCDLVTGLARQRSETRTEKLREPKTCNVLALRAYTERDRLKCTLGGDLNHQINLGGKGGINAYYAPNKISGTGKLFILLKNPALFDFGDILKLTKLGTMASPFLEKLQSDFARELARIGVPELTSPIEDGKGGKKN